MYNKAFFDKLETPQQIRATLVGFDGSNDDLRILMNEVDDYIIMRFPKEQMDYFNKIVKIVSESKNMIKNQDGYFVFDFGEYSEIEIESFEFLIRTYRTDFNYHLCRSNKINTKNNIFIK